MDGPGARHDEAPAAAPARSSDAPVVNSRGGRARAVAGTLAAVVVAILATEVLLRIAIPPEDAFGTWFSRGVHTPDGKYGLVFTPGFRGVMSHPDGVPCVPLELDAHGHRLPSGPEGAPEVLVIGGSSMMFSYGLPDRDAIHTQTALRAATPLRVLNTAWPGFDLARNFHAQRDLLGPDHRPDVAVIAFYRLGPRPRPPETFDPLPPPQPREKLFEFFDDLAPGPRDPVTRRLGRLYYATCLGARGVGFLKSAYLRCRSIAGSAREMISWGGKSPVSEGALAPEDLDRQRAFFERVCGHFVARGARVLVVLLPAAARGADHYAGVASLVPDGVPCVDLHRELGTELLEGHTIAAGHYDAHAAAQIGARIAEEVSRLLADAAR